jgi:hypothetical protein
MNDIERYNFWHQEMDAYVKKKKEETAIVDFAKRIGKPFENLPASTFIELDKKIKGA